MTEKCALYNVSAKDIPAIIDTLVAGSAQIMQIIPTKEGFLILYKE